MAAGISIAAWLLLFCLGLCRLSCGQTPPCERIKPCSCSGRHVNCRNVGLTRVPQGIPTDTLTLDLSRNSIEEINVTALAKLKSLQKLKLNRNKLAAIPTDALSLLNSLVSLDLRKNKLRFIPPGSFRGLHQLKILKLSKNRISGMENVAFLGLDKLEQIHLDWNNFSVLDITWFFGMFNLQSLFLQNNQISQIKTDREDWRGFDHLSEINLARNRLSNISNLTFRNLLSLIILNLAGNGISHITHKTFRDLHKLQSLRLDDNRITALSNNAFHGLSKLKSLNLSANAISTVEEHAFSGIKRLNRLWLNTSHLMCDCKIVWLPGWLLAHLETLDSVHARCKLPQRLFMKSIFNISSSLFVCDASTASPQISRHPASKQALVGQNVTMTCRVEVFQRNESNLRLSWTRGSDTTIKMGRIANHAKATTETMMTYTSVLHLTRVGFHDDGFYRCFASNKFGVAFSKKAKLDVHEFPSFILTPKNVTVLAGETIHLPCAAKGHPKPRLSWRKDKGNTMFSAAEERRIVHQESKNLFLIIHSKAQDTGWYTCSAANEAGSINSSAFVTVLQIPRFMLSMSSKTVKEGESVVFDCIANGNPQPRFAWFKDRHPLTLNSRVTTHLNDQLLVIIRAELDDEGVYGCEVTNALGTARQSAELTVITGDGEENSDEAETSALRYDKKTFLGIIVIVVVSCVVGTSLVWLFVIYCARRNSHQRQKLESLHTTTAPREDVSYIPLKSYSSGSTQTSRGSPGSTATFLTSSGSQASTLPPSTASSEQNCDLNEKSPLADNASSETSKGSRSSLTSSCRSSVEQDPPRQVIHVQIHNSDSDSEKSAPTHRKEANRDSIEYHGTQDCTTHV